MASSPAPLGVALRADSSSALWLPLLCCHHSTNEKLTSLPTDIWTYDVHEGQEVLLNVFPAVEEMNGIIHSQQNLEEGSEVRGQHLVDLNGST